MKIRKANPGETCDTLVGRLSPGVSDPEFGNCAEPAVAVIEMFGDGGACEERFCAEHALKATSRINYLVTASIAKCL
jgi:hypothetical protein